MHSELPDVLFSELHFLVAGNNAGGIDSILLEMVKACFAELLSISFHYSVCEKKVFYRSEKCFCDSCT